MNDKFKREIITTADGSTTIHLPELDEQYHSKHGAINEAMHVFIKNGFNHLLSHLDLEVVHILEIGFGTGLNAFITFLEGKKKEQKINYVGVEGYPVVFEEVQLMNYPEEMNAKGYEEVFELMHQSSWEAPSEISQEYILTKRQQFFNDIHDQNSFNVIYFDAFGARVQPELWTVAVFQKMYNALKNNGVLVTYSAKGSVRRAMQEVGFVVERLPGPPGKREMLRATKSI